MKVKVRSSKGEIFEIEESQLEGEICPINEKITNAPKIDIERKLSEGYITLEDYIKKHQ